MHVGMRTSKSMSTCKGTDMCRFLCVYAIECLYARIYLGFTYARTYLCMLPGCLPACLPVCVSVSMYTSMYISMYVYVYVHVHVHVRVHVYVCRCVGV